MTSGAFRQLPMLLHPDYSETAIAVLERYFARPGKTGLPSFTGSRFDVWDPSGTRASSTDVFTSDDLVAVSLLSVEVPAPAAIQLLEIQASRFTQLLQDVGPDGDLVDRTTRFTDDGPEWGLWSALVELDGIGPTTASKLYARKRPRLRPIYDSVIAGVLGSTSIWEPLRATLNDCDWLHPHLESLHRQAHLDPAVPALRVFDVLVWMTGKERLHSTSSFDPTAVH